jgi:hypothetical protein
VQRRVVLVGVVRATHILCASSNRQQAASAMSRRLRWRHV